MTIKSTTIPQDTDIQVLLDDVTNTPGDEIVRGASTWIRRPLAVDMALGS